MKISSRATLTKEEIEKIILTSLKNSGMIITSGLSFDISSKCEGYGMGEHYTYDLSGVSFNVETELKK